MNSTDFRILCSSTTQPYKQMWKRTKLQFEKRSSFKCLFKTYLRWPNHLRVYLYYLLQTSIFMFVLPFASANHLSTYLLIRLRVNHLNWVFEASSEDLITSSTLLPFACGVLLLATKIKKTELFPASALFLL